MNEPSTPRKGSVLELAVTGLAFGGQGVARVDGFTVFVDGGIPGQRVAARILRRKKTYAEAVVESVVEPSPDQVAPPCAHFGLCGGCRLQHLAYEAQLREKREQVRDCLVRLGGLDGVEVEPTLAAPAPYEYRNKMEYSFSNARWIEDGEPRDVPVSERFGLGLHPRGRFERVLEIGRCHLQGPEGSELLAAVRRSARGSGVPAYSTRDHRGFWRFLVVREGRATGERMVLLITNRAAPGSPEDRALDRMVDAVRASGVPVTSLLHGVTERKSAVAYCDEVRVLAGEPAIRETLLGHTFEIGANTFFQTNTAQAERLFTEAIARGDLTSDDTVWDLYCGVGALTLPLARRARFVRGVELVPAAVEAAERNARRNGVENVAFEAGDIREIVGRARPEAGALPDVVVLDPPRDGVHPDVVRAILDAAPKRIVYVSCNPATLARDLRLFVDGGYALGPVLPVDMFPQTAHVECVTRLVRTA